MKPLLPLNEGWDERAHSAGSDVGEDFVRDVLPVPQALDVVHDDPLVEVKGARGVHVGEEAVTHEPGFVPDAVENGGL